MKQDTSDNVGRLRVLVACEFSGRVRDAFRKLGHDAWGDQVEDTIQEKLIIDKI